VRVFNPKHCEKLVGNLLNPITIKLYISVRHFQLYKERMKHISKSKVMAKIQLISRWKKKHARTPYTWCVGGESGFSTDMPYVEEEFKSHAITSMIKVDLLLVYGQF